MRYEYKVIPAPTRGQKAKGLKTAEARFAYAIETVMNDLAGENWEYLRADTLPSEERQGLGSSSPSFRTLLIFRRPLQADPAPFQPRLLDAQPEPMPVSAPAPRAETVPGSRAEPEMTRAAPETPEPETARPAPETPVAEAPRPAPELPEAEVPKNPAPSTPGAEKTD